MSIKVNWRRLFWRNRSLLISFAVTSAIVFAFMKLTSEVFTGETNAIDRHLLLALRRPMNLGKPIGPPWLLEAAVNITSLGSAAALTMITAAVAGYLAVKHQLSSMWFVIVSVGGGALMGYVLKLVYERPRPAIVPHLAPVSLTSFPSGHATDSAIVYLTLAALMARSEPSGRARIYVVGVAIILVIMIGVSRVYLGVHWPSDVLAGWIVGAAWALFSASLFAHLRFARR